MTVFNSNALPVAFVVENGGMATVTDTTRLPTGLYRAAQVRELDRRAIEEFGIPGFTLMSRAGAAAYSVIRERFPHSRELTIFCGVGNNAGDGYVVARIARDAGLGCRVIAVASPELLRDDAARARDEWLAADGQILALSDFEPQPDTVLVDALVGTGLDRPLSGEWSAAVETMNDSGLPIVALDIPSGIHADTGQVMGIAVRAARTVSFIGLKQGMLTGEAVDHCGAIDFFDLEVPPGVYTHVDISSRALDLQAELQQLPLRPPSAHKGTCGQVLVVGGAPGMSGAPLLAAAAAARAGAGLVRIATHESHAGHLNLWRPELMVSGVSAAEALAPWVAAADTVVAGPGLGQGAWALALLEQVLACGKSLVLDADALNLIAKHQLTVPANSVITPHPGEASRLLDCSVREVEQDRFVAVEALHDATGAVAVLKGAGTLVADGSATYLCKAGNAGMASGGMGDLLAGLIGSLIAQGMAVTDATRLGVCVHAAAGDAAAGEQPRGMLAGDLLPEIRRLLNPSIDGNRTNG